jgi:hypothetical protein
MHDRLLAESTENRELHRLRHECQSEVEVEDIGARQESQQGGPLGELLSGKAAVALERPVGLGVERVAVEDDELRVDSMTAKSLDVRPGYAGRVDRAMDDAQALLRGVSPQGSDPG